MQTPTQICYACGSTSLCVFVCVFLYLCVCMCMYVCVWLCMCVCISYSIRLAFGTVFHCRGESNSHSNYEMCQVQQTVTNLWQAAHTRPGPDPPTVQHPPSPCYSSSTPTTRSSSCALGSKSACNSIKMQKDFNASGTSKWSVCSPVSARCQYVYVVCIPCIGSKGCVCHVLEKLIKVLPFICY